MKRVFQEEISEWVCDATGKEIGKEMKDSPSCQVKFSFGYGSDLDGLYFDLDFDDKIAQDIMDMLHDKFPNVAKIIDEKKEQMKW